MSRRKSAKGRASNVQPQGKAVVSPQAAASMPSHEAAGTGRRLRGWIPGSSGPNRANHGASVIRNRARDLGRNEWIGRGIPTRWSVNLVGTGILARPDVEEAATKALLGELWDTWMEECDADGVLDGYGQQNSIAYNWIQSGEVFARLRPRRPEDGLSVPLQVQLLESDMVPMLDSTAPNGNEIRSGIEFNAIGQRVAYWMYRNHPGDGKGNTGDYVRVPAQFVIHVYEPTRPGQLRGVSDIAPIMTKLRSIANYDDAVLFRQEIANLFAGFIESAPSSDSKIDPLTGKAITADGDGMPMVAMEPGTMQGLLPGEKVTFSDPPDSGANYSDFMRAQVQFAAAGAGLPYELLTGDIRDVSDRTLRVVITEFRRYVQQRQWLILIPQWCRRIRRAWADAALLSGALNADQAKAARRVTWQPQGWEYIHPVQDVQARKIAVESGFKSRSDVITESGNDPETVDRTRAADRAREKALELTAPPPEPPK